MGGGGGGGGGGGKRARLDRSSALSSQEASSDEDLAGVLATNGPPPPATKSSGRAPAAEKPPDVFIPHYQLAQQARAQTQATIHAQALRGSPTDGCILCNYGSRAFEAVGGYAFCPFSTLHSPPPRLHMYYDLLRSIELRLKSLGSQRSMANAALMYAFTIVPFFNKNGVDAPVFDREKVCGRAATQLTPSPLGPRTHFHHHPQPQPPDCPQHVPGGRVYHD